MMSVSRRRVTSFTVAWLSLSACAFADVQQAVWTAPGNGEWHYPTPWSVSPVIPTNTATARFAVELPAHVAAYTVTVGNNNPTVDTIAVGSNATLLIGGPTVTVTDSLAIGDGGHVTIKQGSLVGGTLRTEGSGSLSSYTQGELKNVTIAGRISTTDELDLSGSSHLENGEIHLAGAGDLYVVSNYLSGFGRVIFDGRANSQTTINSVDPNPGHKATLTIGSEIELIANGRGGGVSGSVVINEGTIRAESVGSSFSASSAGSFTNRGSISVSGGGIFIMPSDWRNEGHISVNQGTLWIKRIPTAMGDLHIDSSTLFLSGGSLTNAELHLLQPTNTAIRSGAIFDNRNATLAVGEGSNRFTLVSGTLLGGRIEAGNAASPLSVIVNATIEDAQVDTDIDVSSGGALTLSKATALLAPHIVRLAPGATSGYATLVLADTAGLSSGTVVEFGGITGSTLEQHAGASLTISAGVEVRTGTGGGTIRTTDAEEPPAVIDVVGTVRAVTPGKTVTFLTQTVANHGLIEARDATVIANGFSAATGSAAPIVFNNINGTLHAARAGKIQVNGSLSLSATGAVAIELASAGASGLVSVRDAATLGGNLDLSLAAAYVATPGTTHRIITAGISRTGTFSGITGIAASADQWLAVVYDAMGVNVVAAIPGDANLSGSVGFTDLLALAQSYSANTTGRTWVTGDFTGDGIAGFADLLALAQRYTGGALSADSGISATFAEDWALAQALVPEPTVALTGMIATLSRRRRR